MFVYKEINKYPHITCAFFSRKKGVSNGVYKSLNCGLNSQDKKNNVLKPKRGINSIKLYKGGISKISGIDKIIKLSSNESPFGPSKSAIEAYKKTYDKFY